MSTIKKMLLVLVLAIVLIGCEKETIIVIEDDHCEECVGATVSLSPQARGPVDRDGMFAWIKDITIVAEDEQSVDYGDVFTLVDDNSGTDGFYLTNVPTREIIDFSASSTSVESVHNGQTLVGGVDPNNLDLFVGRLPYAEYATSSPVSQYIENGDNLVYLQMNTEHGRLISSFQLATSIQSGYDLIVVRGADNETSNGSLGIVSYWNSVSSTDGQTQTFNIEVRDAQTQSLVYTRTVTETIVASTSTTNKYVVGLDFVESSTVEVIFSWQVWNEDEGEDETDVVITDEVVISGGWSMTEDYTVTDSNIRVNGGLNLNGYTLTTTNGGITVNGGVNGGGSINYCTTLDINGSTQNNPTITQECN